MRRLVAAVGVTMALGGCGSESGPTTPTTVTRAQLPPEVPAGTTLTIVSGEDGAPVASARVVVAGKTFVTGADGQLSLPESFPRDSTLDILHPEFLDRQTRLRDPAATTRYPLWPRTSPTGLDETSTFELVYGVSERRRPMMRIVSGTSEAYIVPSPAIRRDARSMDKIRETADVMTGITHGEIQFIVAEEAPEGAVVFELVIAPGDPAIVDSVAAAKRRLRNWAITGGTVVYAVIGTVRTSTTPHELGHMFGLAHSTSVDDVMHGSRRSNRTEGFSAREALMMRLMLKRPAGNEMPDNDRGGSASTLRAPGKSWTSVVVCR